RGRRLSLRLRQLAHADEIFWKRRADAVDEVVADLRPFEAHGKIADMVPHTGSARREDRQVRAALALKFQLRALDARADLFRSEEVGASPCVCGNWHTPMKFFGNAVQTRWMRSLQICVHSRLTAKSPIWCPIPEARGEKIVRSVPRSR